jgi:hypothetical protein
MEDVNSVLGANVQPEFDAAPFDPILRQDPAPV